MLGSRSTPWARRTARLDHIVHHRGVLSLGRRPAASFARRLMLPVSNHILLRVVRRRGLRPFVPPRVIGNDDWAWQRNQRYGTIAKPSWLLTGGKTTQRTCSDSRSQLSTHPVRAQPGPTGTARWSDTEPTKFRPIRNFVGQGKPNGSRLIRPTLLKIGRVRFSRAVGLVQPVVVSAATAANPSSAASRACAMSASVCAAQRNMLCLG